MNRIILSLVVTLLFSLSSVAMAREGLPDFTSLVKKNHMAVVNISTQQGIGEDSDSDGSDNPDLEDPTLDDLIKRYNEQQQPRNPFESNAMGSGFIISEDGFILTNNHVVEGADKVLVRLHDRRQLSASVVGTDPRSDVALLKVDAKGLPTVSIGNSDALEVGEWVLAIGSPFGFDFSVTAGIVSATGRALPNESYVPFIQTDVAINPGNSGGPLFNLDGDVIGINSQIFSRTGSFMGLSFAIPIEMAMDVSQQLRSNGRVARGWLGVIIQEVTMELAESLQMPIAHGALITSILDNGPASQSELQVGDVITYFDGKRIERSSSLPPLVGRVPANADAEVMVMRNGEEVELLVNIGELPGDEQIRQSIRPTATAPTENLLQLTVKPLTEEDRTVVGVDKGGVLVDTVEPDGPADKAGIVAGDIISTVDNKSVDSPSDLAEVLGELEGRKSVAVLVHRSDGPVFLALKIDE